MAAKALARLEALEQREAATAAQVEALSTQVATLELNNTQLELKNSRLEATVRAIQQHQQQCQAAAPPWSPASLSTGAPRPLRVK